MDDEHVITCMDDPAVSLDADWRVLEANEAFGALVGGAQVAGLPVEDVFAPDDDLAERHADILTHYPDVGGVVDGDRRHFDPDHETIAALREHRDPREDDPDVGVFVDGDRRYYHLNAVEVDHSDVHLVVFRDVTDLKDRERDLDFLRQVMGRVLRHNLRNEISVIRGQATVIAEMSDDQRAELARTIQRKSDSLVQTSEKTRLIEKAIENDDRHTYHLPSVIEDGIAAADRPADADEVTVETTLADVSVRAVRSFGDALQDTIENAIIYSEGGTVDISVTREDGWATITVADDGPGIPDRELETLERRGETDLVHGSGAGLWLIYTTVRESGGNVVFDTDDGTTVTIRLPTVES